MQQVISELERLGRRSRMMLIVQRASVIVGWAVGVLLAVILFDYALRVPGGFRLVLLLAGIGALAYAVWVHLLPAMVFRPTLTQLALRVERVMPALAGRLASSVEFAAAGVDQGNQLAARTVRETQTRLQGESVDAVIHARRTWRDVGIMLAVLAVAATFIIADPASAGIGLRRVFMPYGEAKWPARTGVESRTSITVHPRGQSLMLRAAVTRGSAVQRIDAHYRLTTNGNVQPWQRLVLTHQAGVGEGNIHERLIDTGSSGNAGAEAIEFYFASDDDETSSQQITLVPPPAVRRAALTVTPPTYAAEFVPILLAELGQGLDARAVTERPVLVGSSATLELEFNKPLPRPDSFERALGFTPTEHEQPRFSARDSEGIWTVEWTVSATRSLTLRLEDEYGLTNADPIAFRIEAVVDSPPAATMTHPGADEIALGTAVIALRAEARDDVALDALGIDAHVQTGGRSADESVELTPNWQHTQAVGQPTAVANAELDLGQLHPNENETVLISAIARDVHGQVTRSPLRRLRIVSDTDFATQLRRQLSAVRQNAIRIEALQAELQDDVSESGIPEGSGLERAQAQLAERIASQRQSVNDVERLLRSNRLDDAQLSQILQQANDLLDAAGRAANKAVEAMEKGASATQPQNEGAPTNPGESKPAEAKPSAAGATSAPQQSPPQDNQAGEAPSQQESEGEPTSPPQAKPQSPAQREVTEAQQEVRDELTDLIQLLDRDEDTWVVRRQLENLLREQQQLEQATSQLGDQTMGRTPDQLTEQQRTELDRIAQRQRDLRDEARKMIENMRNRAKAMEQVDAQAAQSMRTAADTAEQRQLDQDMENAAQRAQQNQMTSATASQQSAQSTLQRMREDIENTRRAQAQQLIRQLASLVESIQRLIAVQENELIALGLARDTQNYSGLDRGMIRLNQNTQAVAGEARAAGNESRRIARTLDRAADTQGAAVAAFRAEPVNADEAQAAEDRSLALLKEAKKQAEELQQQTQEQEVQRRREELITKYREYAERQVAVREETLPLAAVPQLDRRQLVDSRRLGNAQDDIRKGLAEMRDVTAEILDSPIFVHVHRMIDGWSSAVSDSLAQGAVTIDVTDRQQQIADSVGRLIKALEESTAPPPEFQENQQQGGEGQGEQGQQPLIPPIAQLKLLREIQEQVYNLTKDLDSRSDLDTVQKRTRLRDVGQQQRELMDLGKQMLEALQQQQQNQPPPAPQPQPQLEMSSP